MRHDITYLVEDKICILRRSFYIKFHLAAEALTLLWLRQISHHRSGILTPISHLVKINEDARVAMIKVNSLREEHRCIAMGVECENFIMQLLSNTKLTCLFYKPTEYLLSILLQPFWMPLHTENRLVLAALYGLDDVVGRTGNDTEALAGLAHCLMMKRIDHDAFTAIYII